MSIWVEIEELNVRWDVRHHALHCQWRDKRLDAEELGIYGGQYGAVVAAFAKSAERLAVAESDVSKRVLLESAKQNAAQAERWLRLAEDAGHDDVSPTASTLDCASVWGGNETRGQLRQLVLFYAINRARSSVALCNQEAFEGAIAVTEPMECVAAEARLSAADAISARALIKLALPGQKLDQDDILSHVEAAYSVHWDLLDETYAAVTRRRMAPELSRAGSALDPLALTRPLALS